MLWSQGGRCYYSGVPIEYLQPHSDWRISLERLNNEVGYLRWNCVLVACEFNSFDFPRNRALNIHGSQQWSRQKVALIWGPYWDDSPKQLCTRTVLLVNIEGSVKVAPLIETEPVSFG